MRPVPILFFAAFFGGTLAAYASPVFPQALGDSELAANRAGGMIALRFEARAENLQPVTMTPQRVTPGLFGIQTIVLDTGISSVSGAITGITLHATLNGTGL